MVPHLHGDCLANHETAWQRWTLSLSFFLSVFYLDGEESVSQSGCSVLLRVYETLLRFLFLCVSSLQASSMIVGFFLAVQAKPCQLNIRSLTSTKAGRLYAEGKGPLLASERATSGMKSASKALLQKEHLKHKALRQSWGEKKPSAEPNAGVVVQDTHWSICIWCTKCSLTQGCGILRRLSVLWCYATPKMYEVIW